jgi:hypothetical protein
MKFKSVPLQRLVTFYILKMIINIQIVGFINRNGPCKSIDIIFMEN